MKTLITVFSFLAFVAGAQTNQPTANTNTAAQLAALSNRVEILQARLSEQTAANSNLLQRLDAQAETIIRLQKWADWQMSAEIQRSLAGTAPADRNAIADELRQLRDSMQTDALGLRHSVSDLTRAQEAAEYNRQMERILDSTRRH